jgi:multidrug efflux pump subunit AcrA (membrane-fusion protein)
LCAGVLNFVEVQGKIKTLISQRDSYHSERDTVQGELDTTKKDLAKTEAELTQTQQQLADANAARKKAEDVAAAQMKRADDLSDKLAKTTQERDDAQSQLEAYKSTGKSPEEVTKLVQLIKQDDDAISALNDEKKVLNRELNRVKNQLAELTGTTNYVVQLPADLKGKVIVVDPKWDFVVLNIGDEQGVLEDGEMLVSRDGKLVAKVIVRSVEKNRCVANVVPGWKLGEIFEGDEVTPAHPAS